MNGGTSRCASHCSLWSASIQRPAKFALVGAIGVVVQLATLEALTAFGLPLSVGNRTCGRGGSAEQFHVAPAVHLERPRRLAFGGDWRSHAPLPP